MSWWKCPLWFHCRMPLWNQSQAILDIDSILLIECVIYMLVLAHDYHVLLVDPIFGFVQIYRNSQYHYFRLVILFSLILGSKEDYYKNNQTFKLSGTISVVSMKPYWTGKSLSQQALRWHKKIQQTSLGENEIEKGWYFPPRSKVTTAFPSSFKNVVFYSFFKIYPLSNKQQPKIDIMTKYSELQSGLFPAGRTHNNRTINILWRPECFYGFHIMTGMVISTGT